MRSLRIAVLAAVLLPVFAPAARADVRIPPPPPPPPPGGSVQLVLAGVAAAVALAAAGVWLTRRTVRKPA